MLKVGIVQASPVFWNLEESLAKANRLVEQAAEKGARVVVFGEAWLTGYPAWLDYCHGAALWDHGPTKEVFAQLRQNSLVIPSRESQMLASAARDYEIVLVMGVNERVDFGPGNRTLYNTLLTFNSDGSLVNHHRKLIPTYTERLVWGQGGGAGLKAVDTSAGRSNKTPPPLISLKRGTLPGKSRKCTANTTRKARTKATTNVLSFVMRHAGSSSFSQPIKFFGGVLPNLAERRRTSTLGSPKTHQL